jgi:hypothetical protein
MAGSVKQVEAAVAEIVDRAHAADYEFACVEANLVHFSIGECGRKNRGFGAHWRVGKKADLVPEPTMRVVLVGKVDGSPI